MTKELLEIINSSTTEFSSVPREAWIHKSHPSKWSKKEILGHLIDSALTNLRRFVMTQYQQNLNIVYHQDEWVELQNYQEADIAELVDLWRLLNLQIVRVVDRIPADKLQNVCDTGKKESKYDSLEFLIEDYLVHLKHHLDQILGS
ncbi:MAG: DinB family protein [Saprospiraceae bacterium]|nr:DinB family protein [Saprospiraceae bacterium]